MKLESIRNAVKMEFEHIRNAVKMDSEHIRNTAGPIWNPADRTKIEKSGKSAEKKLSFRHSFFKKGLKKTGQF